MCGNRTYNKMARSQCNLHLSMSVGSTKWKINWMVSQKLTEDIRCKPATTSGLQAENTSVTTFKRFNIAYKFHFCGGETCFGVVKPWKITNYSNPGNLNIAMIELIQIDICKKHPLVQSRLFGRSFSWRAEEYVILTFTKCSPKNGTASDNTRG